jgi:alpha-tubulin suppressor-like RCC1 family protein
MSNRWKGGFIQAYFDPLASGAGWKQFSGQWTVTQAAQAKGAGTWPRLPGAPTIGTATAGVGEVSVAFTPPASSGYPPALTYEVTSSPGSITASGSVSPITVTGLTNGTEYTFTVIATNDTGTGPASAASNAATPIQAGAIWYVGANSNGMFGNATIANGNYNTITEGAYGYASYTRTTGRGNQLALRANGTMWSWASNGSGESGTNSTINRSSPVQVGSLTTWASVASPQANGLAVKTDGTLWAWGNNQQGVFGNSRSQGDGFAAVSSPIQIGASTDWAELFAGYHNVIAIKTDGTLWGWGHNTGGTLGINNTISRSSPVQISSDTNWAKVAVGVSGGGQDHCLAIKTDGTLWAWGDNDYGNLFTNNTIAYSSPVQIGSDTDWSEVSGGLFASYAVKTDGTMWSAGYDSGYGQLGLGTRSIDKSSPTQIGALTTWLKATGGYYSNVAVKTDGTLWSWGNNNAGQLGQGTTGSATSRSVPTQIGSDTNWALTESNNLSTGTHRAIKV